MKIILAADHAGFALKEDIKSWLGASGYFVEDVGVFGGDSADYPYLAQRGAKAVVVDKANRGIFFCGSGNGMSLVANKTRGARAINARSAFEARGARREGDINVLSLGSNLLTKKEAQEIIKAFLEMRFVEKERYLRRLEQIKNIENKLR